MTRPVPGPPTQPLPPAAEPASHVIAAAGAVCWHVRHGALRVLLIHRPRYDDWSWPKGKLEKHEGFVEAAHRELTEETGLNVRLGVPLPAARYRLGDDLGKHVAYWAAHVPDLPLPALPRPHEVDACEWVSVIEATRRLTRRGDRTQLQAVVAAHEAGVLDTWPLVVVRHTVAHPRDRWRHPDSERPLLPRGARQAAMLVGLLAAWSPDLLVCSPWKRCTDTLLPYRRVTGTPMHPDDRLSERGHRRTPQEVAALVRSLVGDAQPVAVCTHRPVLGTLLGALAELAAPGIGESVPTRDPYLAAGEVLVAHVSRDLGTVVAVERHLPGRP